MSSLKPTMQEKQFVRELQVEQLEEHRVQLFEE
jgi:hypothetical protein